LADSVATNLDGGNVGVLGDVLVLVERILGEFSLLLLYRQLDQENHDRFEGRDGHIAGSLGGDVLVKEGEGGRGLVDPDELLGALEDILRLLMRRRRLSTDVSGGPEGQRGSWAVVTARGGWWWSRGSGREGQ